VAVSQTLAAAVQDFSLKRGLEKNLFCRRLFQGIIYSKESIRINLVPPAAESAAANEFIPDPVKASAHGARNEKSPDFVGGFSGNSIKDNCLSRRSTNHIIPIILPNTIHHCKKKDL
jgi:hypothetical protein